MRRIKFGIMIVSCILFMSANTATPWGDPEGTATFCANTQSGLMTVHTSNPCTGSASDRISHPGEVFILLDEHVLCDGIIYQRSIIDEYFNVDHIEPCDPE